MHRYVMIELSSMLSLCFVLLLPRMFHFQLYYMLVCRESFLHYLDTCTKANK